MGIPGLLQKLTSITTKKDVQDYAGLKVAIDAHIWLHRGGYNCSRELAEGLDTTKYVDYCLNILEMLKTRGVVDVTVVFDGASLPIKTTTNLNRGAARALNRALAQEAAGLGDDALAMKHYQRSVSVTSAMVEQAILALQRAGHKFLVAPYESDAQLAFMAKVESAPASVPFRANDSYPFFDVCPSLSVSRQSGLVDVVISEDSDLLVYDTTESLSLTPLSLSPLSLTSSCTIRPSLSLSRLSPTPSVTPLPDLLVYDTIEALSIPFKPLSSPSLALL